MTNNEVNQTNVLLRESKCSQLEKDNKYDKLRLDELNKSLEKKKREIETQEKDL